MPEKDEKGQVNVHLFKIMLTDYAVQFHFSPSHKSEIEYQAGRSN